MVAPVSEMDVLVNISFHLLNLDLMILCVTVSLLSVVFCPEKKKKREGRRQEGKRVAKKMKGRYEGRKNRAESR